MLDEKGFRRKTYTELLDEMQIEAKAKFGDDVNLGVKSPLGIILYLYAWFLSIVWLLAEKVYYSGFIGTATGEALDRLLPYGGTKRIGEEYAIGKIKITGEPNQTITAGFQGATKQDIFFETIDDCLLNDSGIGYVPIQALEVGPSGNVIAGEINVIVNPNANVTSIINEEATSGGRSRETDAEAKDRYSKIESRGASTLDSIYSAVSDVKGVRTVKVIENDTDTTDSGGRPPHSFETLVLGGNTQDVAEAIFSKKPAGIQSYGSTTATVVDKSGTNRTVKFSFASVLNVYANVSVKRNNTFPEDGSDQVRTQILKYIGGLDESGDVYPGLDLGSDVIHSTALRKVTVVGIDDITIKFSTNGSTYSEENIDVGTNVAETSYEKVVVTLV